MNMKLVYSSSSMFPDTADPHSHSVTVLVNRVVSSTDSQSFLAELRNLLEEFDRFPGTAGSLVFQQSDGDTQVEFSILQRFASEEDHQAWRASPGFDRWLREIAPQTPMPNHVRHYSGVESLFVSDRTAGAPPLWKMTILLIIAAYPMTLASSYWIVPALSGLPMLLSTLIMSLCVVSAMTYVLVPLLTRIFRGWLESA